MSKKPKKFHQKERRVLTDEEAARRRAVIFGFLSILLLIIIVFAGIPLFMKLVAFIGDIKTEDNQLIEQDIIPPLSPRLFSIPEATNSANFLVSGITEPNVTVKINFNSEIIETEADKDGEFLVEKLSLVKGSNSLYAWAIDQADNESEKTETVDILYDTEAPKLEISSPEDNSVAEEQTIEIQGQTEEGARVLVNDHIVIVEKEGKFSYRITLQEGNNQLIIISQDKAGNETERKINVTYFP